MVIAWLILTETRLGRYTYAIDGNEETVQLSGINANFYKTMVYMISGIAAAVSALILTSRLNSAEPVAGQGYELDVIAAVVIGGTTLSGGCGGVWGTLIGALLIGVINNGMNLLGISPYFQLLVKGLIIIGAVLLDRLRRSRYKTTRRPVVLTTRLLHPEILAALGTAGHGSRVLIADGNYPFSTGSSPDARLVFLNLRPGLVSVLDVLETLVSVLPIESALVMVPPQGPEPAIQAEMRKLLPPGVPMEARGRNEFYAEAKSPDTSLVIATGEERIFANIMLVIGVVRPA